MLARSRSQRDLNVFGCGLAHTIAETNKDAVFRIQLHITTAYMPISSDNKAPDLTPFLDAIQDVVGRATRKARRPNVGGEKVSQKDVVLAELGAAIADASGDGEFLFSDRQLLYALRKIVMDRLGQELKLSNWKKIITAYENGQDIPGMYREARGTVYHPHTGETIPLGTLNVASYERPIWTYSTIVYIEKEGWAEALKAARWPERHDCAMMSSKGFSTRAARDLIDKLAEHNEPITVLCVHDADAAGITAYLEGWGGGGMATLYAETCRDIGLRPARAPRERDPERWLTIKQAAARLGVSARTLRKLVNDGELAYVDVGGGRERRSMRFTPQDIEAFLAKRRGTACRSRSVANSGTTSLNIGVIDFGALRAARASAKPKSSSAPSGKRRRKRTNVIKL